MRWSQPTKWKVSISIFKFILPDIFSFYSKIRIRYRILKITIIIGLVPSSLSLIYYLNKSLWRSFIIYALTLIILIKKLSGLHEINTVKNYGNYLLCDKNFFINSNCFLTVQFEIVSDWIILCKHFSFFLFFYLFKILQKQLFYLFFSDSRLQFWCIFYSSSA